LQVKILNTFVFLGNLPRYLQASAKAAQRNSLKEAVSIYKDASQGKNEDNKIGIFRKIFNDRLLF
jgi:hypothetical protein